MLIASPPATGGPSLDPLHDLAQLITPRIGLSLALSIVIGVLVTWIGLALAYFYGYPVGFYITTIAFAAYVLARAVTAVADRAGPLISRSRAFAADR